MFNRNLNHLRLSESGPNSGWARWCNRVLDEIQRRTVTVGPGLRLRDDGLQGLNLSANPPASNNGVSTVRFGVVATDFSSGTKITLTPSTIDGAISDPAPDTVDVYVKQDKSSLTIPLSLNIPADTVVAYVEGDGGDLFILGAIEVVMVPTEGVSANPDENGCWDVSAKAIIQGASWV